jgi:hypothetical protein
MSLEYSEFYNSNPLYPIDKWQVGDNFTIGGSTIKEGSCAPLVIDQCKFIENPAD